MLVAAGTRTVAMGAAFDISQTATEAAAMVIANINRFMMSSDKGHSDTARPSDQHVDLNQLLALPL